MEKVKVTQDIADAIESFLDNNSSGKRGILNKHAINYVSRENKSESWGHPYEPINNMVMSELADALYIGYEVEPQYKVGDWVRNELTKEIFIADEYFVELLNLGTKPYGFIRHATPQEISDEKQRRWWGKHNRKVWELNKGDIIEDLDNENLTRIFNRRINPSYEGDYKIVCFAEDRKDIPND